MTRRLSRFLLILAAPFAVSFTLPSAADAGTYRVYSCKTPDGRIAPTEGWSEFQEGGQFSAPGNGCAMGGPLGAQLNGDFAQPSGTRLGWRYSVPEGTELAGFRMWRHFTTTAAAEMNATPYAYISWPSPNYTPDARETCVAGEGCASLGTASQALTGADLVARGGISTRALYVLAGCGGSAGCVDRNSSVPMASVHVKAFEAHLRDSTAPTVTNVQGTLAEDVVHSGVREVSFRASDSGSGVYRTLAEYQPEGSTAWTPLSTSTVNLNDFRCVDVDPTGNDDPYEFFHQIPCATETGGSHTVDTTQMPSGTHVLRVSVEDAAGNRTTILGPKTFRVSNVGAAGAGAANLGIPNNGVGATNQVRIVLSRKARKTRRLRHGQRFRLVATVRNEAGQPVSGASVDVLQRVRLRGAAYRVVRAPLVSGPRGRIRWTVPAGPSRRIQLAYKANLLNGVYQAVTEVPLEVAARTTLRRNRSTFRNGQTIRFSGRVRSQPTPRGGVLIDMQAFKPGTGWVTFDTTRSGRRGAWRINYRLTSTNSTVRYRFRARVRQDSGYPYAAGRSRPVSVLVRP